MRGDMGEETEAVVLPRIEGGVDGGGVNKPNILTSLLGGDISIQGGFFNTKVAKPACFEIETQTDDLELAGKSTMGGLSLSLSKTDLMERRKLHRGINSPGYAYSDIISVDTKGELWKKYTPTPKNVYKPTGLVGEPTKPVPHSHQGLEVYKPPTPEVTGWADPLSGKKKKKGGKGRVKSSWAGNPKVLEVREEIKKKEREEHKFNIMKAAGLI